MNFIDPLVYSPPAQASPSDNDLLRIAHGAWGNQRALGSGAPKPNIGDRMKKRTFFSFLSKKKAPRNEIPNSANASPTNTNNDKVTVSHQPTMRCKKCCDKIQKVMPGEELCSFCKEWPKISPTRMGKYNSVVEWVGLNNRKESMVKATIIHRMELLEEDAQRICEAPVFRSLMGWSSAE